MEGAASDSAMAALWRNRITGTDSSTPEERPFLGLWQAPSGGTLWPGTQADLDRPAPASEPGDILRQSLGNLAAVIHGRWGKPWQQWASLVPLDPKLASDLKIQPAEVALIDSLKHLETLSHNPRGHLTVEELREQVSRARRVTPRAVTTLAAHSEDWQTRTFRGVRPRRILTELREDQWDIYENRAVATLRNRILEILHSRLNLLYSILQALDESDEHSKNVRGTRYRTHRLYTLWGDASHSRPSRDRLEALIKQLEHARSRLLGLAGTFLFRQMRHYHKVESPLQPTNIFQGDSHYRHGFDLWHKWERAAFPKQPTAADRAAWRKQSCRDWDAFVLLLVIRACQQINFTPTQPGAVLIRPSARIPLRRGWSLHVLSDGSVQLELKGEPHLRVVGLYTRWSARPEPLVQAALQDFLSAQKNRCPLLIVTTEESQATAADWSAPFQAEYQRLRTTSLMLDRVALAEVSPLKIDSTELIVRAIRWITAEAEWPRLPVLVEAPGWTEFWPHLTQSPGIQSQASGLAFSSPPSDRIMAQAQDHVHKSQERLRQIAQTREELKRQEHQARGRGRLLQEINARRKALNIEEDATKRQQAFFHGLAERMLDLQTQFGLLQHCPCCPSTAVTQKAGTSIMTCQCKSEWGRRKCGQCGRDYAFIVPGDVHLEGPTTTFDALKFFGADMCAPLLQPVAAPFIFHDTACPHCHHATKMVGGLG